MNKKGFTVIELIVSISLTLVISVFLVQIVLALDNLYNNSGIKTELLTKQSLISSQINSKLNEKTISSLTSCGSYCLKFNYTDSTNDILKINYSNNTLEFGSFYTKLPEESYFKDVSIDVVYGATIQNDVNNAMLNISIPILNNDIEGDFGVNVVYQFNSDITNIEYVDFANKGSYIVLQGDTEQTFNTKTAYVEQGYTVYDSNGNVITGNVEVDNPLTSIPYKAGNYKIKYSLKDGSGNIISQTTRSIKVTPSTYDITNLVVNGDLNEDYQNIKTSFNSEGYYEYISSDGVYNSGYLRIYPTGTFNYIYIDEKMTIPYNHIFYIQGNYRKSGGGKTAMALHNVTLIISGIRCEISNDTDNWVINSCYGVQNNQSNEEYNLLLYGSTTYVPEMHTDWDNVMLVDLTETFGAGNEPSLEWCDENINWFEGTTKINY